MTTRDGRQPASRRGFLDATLRLAASGGLAAVAGTGAAGCDGPAPDPGGAPSATAAPRPFATGTPGPIAATDLVDVDTLWGWVERMTAAGPRFTGSAAHRHHIDDLERQLRDYGLEVTRHPTPLSQWLARSWSLRVTDATGATRSVPVAYYRPYSGETGPAGVEGPLVDLGAGAEADYQAAGAGLAGAASGPGALGAPDAPGVPGAGSPSGAIVLVDAPVARLRASVLADLAYDVHPPEARAEFAAEDYSRVWLGVPPAPGLSTARAHGAVGMIEVSDMSPALAAGQYTPHQQEHADLPALRVDREQGALLRGLLARGPVRATLVLDADRSRTTVDYLLARLPGAGPRQDPRTVLVATHTDGQNALEENGGPALLALAEYFSRFPAATRRRDLLFMFSPSHMTAETATVKPDEWLREHPDITAGIDMALAVEHLGAMAWDDDGGTGPYRATGRTEPVAVAVGNSETLRRLATDEVRHSDLARTGIQKPFQDGLYGEGTFAYRLGIPTIAMITGPAYLLQVTPGDNLDKLDRDLLHRQTLFLARLLARMTELPPIAELPRVTGLPGTTPA
ncbi:hypothetical protein BBK14_17960 [Parafrankia soli]|uniref:Peptidase M28 n=1 Tax=Parafrankia soli TaxID=2599596 RepID=A0A1S1Q3I1_9ACTN|nr:hypothetical protein [Parafrankia soli]OHV28520.1 hypothetical protein BBK14_17960 [Parafrankia soli]